MGSSRLNTEKIGSFTSTLKMIGKLAVLMARMLNWLLRRQPSRPGKTMRKLIKKPTFYEEIVLNMMMV